MSSHSCIPNSGRGAWLGPHRGCSWQHVHFHGRHMIFLVSEGTWFEFPLLAVASVSKVHGECCCTSRFRVCTDSTSHVGHPANSEPNPVVDSFGLLPPVSSEAWCSCSDDDAVSFRRIFALASTLHPDLLCNTGGLQGRLRAKGGEHCGRGVSGFSA